MAGVGLASVSRVLSDHPDVSPEMRERVMAAVDRLEYKPDLLASSLRKRTSLSVGFIVRDISHPVYAEIALGAEQRLREAGYSMLIANSEDRPELDAAHLRLFEQRRVDGLILSFTSEQHDETLWRLRLSETPIVVLDRQLPPGLSVSRALFDHRTGMTAAVNHLLDLGHRRIALISAGRLLPSAEREAGVADAFATRGLPPTYDVLRGGFTIEHGERAMRELLGRDAPPTAVIAAGYEVLMGTLSAIHDAGLELGRQLSLVSCDEVSLTRLHVPPIAVVTRDTLLMGKHAAELLLRDMAEERPEPTEVVIPTVFEPRASCGPAEAS
jgi:LacI family transcriptional regulator